MPSKVTLKGELLFPSKYLTAEDLKGKDVTVTINKVVREDLAMVAPGGKRAIKKGTTVHFEKASKALVINVTNADSIAAMYGTKAEDWVGKKITLYPTTTMFGREMVTCIRIRETGRPRSEETVPAEQEASV
jgi:hypothetical protein